MLVYLQPPLTKYRRLQLHELQFWYCKLTEDQWGLLLNALAGIKTSVESAFKKSSDAFFDELKKEFADLALVNSEFTAMCSDDTAAAKIKPCIDPYDARYKVPSNSSIIILFRTGIICCIPES